MVLPLDLSLRQPRQIRRIKNLWDRDAVLDQSLAGLTPAASNGDYFRFWRGSGNSIVE